MRAWLCMCVVVLGVAVSAVPLEGGHAYRTARANHGVAERSSRVLRLPAGGREAWVEVAEAARARNEKHAGRLTVSNIYGSNFKRMFSYMLGTLKYDADVKIRFELNGAKHTTKAVDLDHDQSNAADEAETKKAWKDTSFDFVTSCSSRTSLNEGKLKITALDTAVFNKDAVIKTIVWDLSKRVLESGKSADYCTEGTSSKVCFTLKFVSTADSEKPSPAVHDKKTFALPETVMETTSASIGVEFPLALVGGPPGLDLGIDFDALILEQEASKFRMVKGGAKIGLTLKIGVTLYLSGELVLKSSSYPMEEGVGKMIADAAVGTFKYEKAKLLSHMHAAFSAAKKAWKATVAAGKKVGHEIHEAGHRAAVKVHKVEQEAALKLHEVHAELHEVVHNAAQSLESRLPALRRLHSKTRSLVKEFHDSVGESVVRHLRHFFPVHHRSLPAHVKALVDPHHAQMEKLWQAVEAKAKAGDKKGAEAALHKYNDYVNAEIKGKLGQKRSVEDGASHTHTKLAEAVVDSSKAEADKQFNEAMAITLKNTGSAEKSIQMEAMVSFGAKFNFKLGSLKASVDGHVGAGLWGKIKPATPLENEYQLIVGGGASFSVSYEPKVVGVFGVDGISAGAGVTYLHRKDETKIVVTGQIEVSTSKRLGPKQLHSLAAVAMAIHKHMSSKKPKAVTFSGLFGEIPTIIQAVLKHPEVLKELTSWHGLVSAPFKRTIGSKYTAGLAFYFLYLKSSEEADEKDYTYLSKFRGTSKLAWSLEDAFERVLPGTAIDAVEEASGLSFKLGWNSGFTLDVASFKDYKQVPNEEMSVQEMMGVQHHKH